MAATALVAAALEEKDEDSEDSGSDMENEGKKINNRTVCIIIMINPVMGLPDTRKPKPAL